MYTTIHHHYAMKIESISITRLNFEALAVAIKINYCLFQNSASDAKNSQDATENLSIGTENTCNSIGRGCKTNVPPVSELCGVKP